MFNILSSFSRIHADVFCSKIYAHVNKYQVMRIVPQETNHFNDNWISDADRFIYAGLYHSDRLKYPIIKKNGFWHKISWKEVFTNIAFFFNKS